MLPLRSWHVEAIEDVVDSWHSGRGWPQLSISSGNHFIHYLFKFLLNLRSFLSEILVSDFGLAAFVFEDSLNISNRASIASTRRKIDDGSTVFCFVNLVFKR